LLFADLVLWPPLVVSLVGKVACLAVWRTNIY
jgi:hypothetical protein